MRKTVDQATPLLDALTQLFPDSTRTTLRKMLQSGRIRVNSEIEKDARRTLERGDVIDVGQKAMQVALPPELLLLHEDDEVIVVVKSNGLLTVATERERERTAQAFLNDYLKAKGEGRIHVVHRLDRETSGVLVFAKTFEARESLKDRFAEHDVDRVYVAIVAGALNPPKGTFRSHLRERRDLKMVSTEAHPDAKLAVTHYRTLETASPAKAGATSYSMLEIRLETGRKNQIRAHLSEAGHPVVGDRLYGSDESNPLGRLGLHAMLLGFVHPATGEKLTFTSPLPKAFRALFGPESATSREKSD